MNDQSIPPYEGTYQEDDSSVLWRVNQNTHLPQVQGRSNGDDDDRNESSHSYNNGHFGNNGNIHENQHPGSNDGYVKEGYRCDDDNKDDAGGSLLLLRTVRRLTEHGPIINTSTSMKADIGSPVIYGNHHSNSKCDGDMLKRSDNAATSPPSTSTSFLLSPSSVTSPSPSPSPSFSSSIANPTLKTRLDTLLTSNYTTPSSLLTPSSSLSVPTHTIINAFNNLLQESSHSVVPFYPVSSSPASPSTSFSSSFSTSTSSPSLPHPHPSPPSLTLQDCLPNHIPFTIPSISPALRSPLPSASSSSSTSSSPSSPFSSSLTSHKPSIIPTIIETSHIPTPPSTTTTTTTSLITTDIDATPANPTHSLDTVTNTNSTATTPSHVDDKPLPPHPLVMSNAFVYEKASTYLSKDDKYLHGYSYHLWVVPIPIVFMPKNRLSSNRREMVKSLHQCIESANNLMSNNSDTNNSSNHDSSIDRAKGDDDEQAPFDKSIVESDKQKDVTKCIAPTTEEEVFALLRIYKLSQAIQSQIKKCLVSRFGSTFYNTWERVRHHYPLRLTVINDVTQLLRPEWSHTLNISQSLLLSPLANSQFHDKEHALAQSFDRSYGFMNNMKMGADLGIHAGTRGGSMTSGQGILSSNQVQLCIFEMSFTACDVYRAANSGILPRHLRLPETKTLRNVVNPQSQGHVLPHEVKMKDKESEIEINSNHSSEPHYDNSHGTNTYSRHHNINGHDTDSEKTEDEEDSRVLSQVLEQVGGDRQKSVLSSDIERNNAIFQHNDLLSPLESKESQGVDSSIGINNTSISQSSSHNLISRFNTSSTNISSTVRAPIEPASPSKKVPFSRLPLVDTRGMYERVISKYLGGIPLEMMNHFQRGNPARSHNNGEDGADNGGDDDDDEGVADERLGENEEAEGEEKEGTPKNKGQKTRASNRSGRSVSMRVKKTIKAVDSIPSDLSLVKVELCCLRPLRVQDNQPAYDSYIDILLRNQVTLEDIVTGQVEKSIDALSDEEKKTLGWKSNLYAPTTVRINSHCRPGEADQAWLRMSEEMYNMWWWVRERMPLQSIHQYLYAIPFTQAELEQVYVKHGIPNIIALGAKAIGGVIEGRGIIRGEGIVVGGRLVPISLEAVPPAPIPANAAAIQRREQQRIKKESKAIERKKSEQKKSSKRQDTSCEEIGQDGGEDSSANSESEEADNTPLSQLQRSGDTMKVGMSVDELASKLREKWSDVMVAAEHRAIDAVAAKLRLKARKSLTPVTQRVNPSNGDQEAVRPSQQIPNTLSSSESTSVSGSVPDIESDNVSNIVPNTLSNSISDCVSGVGPNDLAGSMPHSQSDDDGFVEPQERTLSRMDALDEDSAKGGDGREHTTNRLGADEVALAKEDMNIIGEKGDTVETIDGVREEMDTMMEANRIVNRYEGDRIREDEEGETSNACLTAEKEEGAVDVSVFQENERMGDSDDSTNDSTTDTIDDTSDDDEARKTSVSDTSDSSDSSRSDCEGDNEENKSQYIGHFGQRDREDESEEGDVSEMIDESDAGERVDRLMLNVSSQYLQLDDVEVNVSQSLPPTQTPSSATAVSSSLSSLSRPSSSSFSSSSLSSASSGDLLSPVSRLLQGKSAEEKARWKKLAPSIGLHRWSKHHDDDEDDAEQDTGNDDQSDSTSDALVDSEALRAYYYRNMGSQRRTSWFGTSTNNTDGNHLGTGVSTPTVTNPNLSKMAEKLEEARHVNRQRTYTQRKRLIDSDDDD